MLVDVNNSVSAVILPHITEIPSEGLLFLMLLPKLLCFGRGLMEDQSTVTANTQVYLFLHNWVT